MGKGDLDAGIAHLERAAEINPDLGYAHLQLGLLYALRGELDEALRVFQQQVDALESSDHALKERTLIELDCKIGATYSENEANSRRGPSLLTGHQDL